MENSEIRIFYSWQSDLPSGETRGLIQDAISLAVKVLRDTVEVEADRDTKGEFGSPDIVQTIFSKIDACDIFIADVSVINKYHSINDEGLVEEPAKLSPNPNVMLELGYAASIVGWDNVICIINIDYGSPADLPFDLAHRRLTPYSLKDKSKPEVRTYIKDIITDTVSNLLENGQRVKSQFSNIVVGGFLPGETHLSKKLIPFVPTDYFASETKGRLTEECNKLINVINGFHLESCIVEECGDIQEVISDTSSILTKLQLLNKKTCSVFITEEAKRTITDFVSEHSKIALADDFFELGDLKRNMSFYFSGDVTFYQGSRNAEKYDKITALCVLIDQITARKLFAETFDRYILIPLAITNISTVADTDITVSIIVDGVSARAVVPSRRIINPSLKGQEGLIYEDGAIKETLLMSESTEIKYKTNISYCITDNINRCKHRSLNGVHYDEEDYERELSKYIAIPSNVQGNAYEFCISSLRPKETCWLGAMIMIQSDNKDFEIHYSIKSKKSDGNLSGILQF